MIKSEKYLLEEEHLYNDSINVFEKRLLANEINCIDPYLDKFPEVTAEHLVLITRHGYYIEKLIEHDNEYILADLIRCGHAREYYEDWAKNGYGEIQKALVEKGLHIDILSQSLDPDVRYAIAEKYPERTLPYLKSLDFEKQRNLGFLLLMAQKKPNTKALRFLLNLDWCDSNYNLQILKSKYDLMHHVPSLIEKTMTPYQLYKTNNPLWKSNLSGYNIASVQQGQQKFDNKDLFMNEHDFNQLATYNNEYYVDFYVDYKLSNRKD